MYLVYSKDDLGPKNGDLDALMPEGQQAISIGDLNTKSRTWKSIIFNANGKRLEIYIDSKINIFVFGPGEDTCYPADYLSDVTDIAITKRNPRSMEI